MDILIGWFLELGQPEVLLSHTTEALTSLHEYWKVNMHWCKDLTGQFLDDAENYCTKLSAQEITQDLDTPVGKVVLLFR